ncbi:MAG TPA: hypothetical protein VK766_08295 [Cytophagaceae bacterium]|jgi:hypothetical protein|nr:hypothetical protein [Cytophagaceae bacterium]
MKPFFLLIFLSIFIEFASAQDLRTNLETAYSNFADAVKNKDADKLKKALCSYSYMTSKNELLSAQVKFPDGYFSSAPRMVMDLKKQTFLKAVENGPTANCIYYGKDAFGTATLIILKFFKEDGSWKFNTLQDKSSEDVMNKLKANDTTFLSGKTFYPDGILPATPAEIVPGEYKALLDVMGYGFNVQIKINGINQPGSFNGKGEASSDILVLGGVKKGVNTIEINVTPIPGIATQKLMINVAVVIQDQEFEVFELEDDKPAASIVKQFTAK